MLRENECAIKIINNDNRVYVYMYVHVHACIRYFIILITDSIHKELHLYNYKYIYKCLERVYVISGAEL